MSPPGEVFGLVVSDGQLHAFGPSYGGGTSIVWRFENGAWSQMGGTFSSTVSSVSTFDGSLVAGGAFTSVGGVAADRLARWNGGAWEDFAPGVPGRVGVLRQHGSRLVVGGSFDGSQAQVSLHAWDGTTWSSLADPIPGWIVDLASRPDGLWAGGSFSTLSGAVTPGVALLRVFPCYGNCDCSAGAPPLNVADFTCFLQRFLAGDERANCDGSSTPPALNVADFACFLREFARGCP
jgi:hypothetical protein